MFEGISREKEGDQIKNNTECEKSYYLLTIMMVWSAFNNS